MDDGRLAIAKLIISVSCIVFFIAFIANIFGQFHSTGTYQVPEDLVSIIKLAFGAGVSVLALSTFVQGRKELEKKKDDNNPPRNS